MYNNTLQTVCCTMKQPLRFYSLHNSRNFRVCFNCSDIIRSKNQRIALRNEKKNLANIVYKHPNIQTERCFHSSSSYVGNSASSVASSVVKCDIKQNQHKAAVHAVQNDRLHKNLMVFALKCVMKMYDLATLPIYSVVQKPWKTLALHNAKKSKVVNKDKHVYGSVIPKSEITDDLEIHGVDTLEKAFSRAIEVHGDRPCSGIRKVINQHKVTDANGKVITKYELGEYEWKSFNDMDKIADNFSLGLASLNIKPKEHIAIFAETREEWLVSVMAAFKRNIPVVTIFTILGDEGVIHAINETEVSCIITSEELIPRCKEILKNTPLVRQVIYIPQDRSDKNNSSYGKDLPDVVNLNSFQEIVSLGTQSTHLKDIQLKPKPEDTAIIMYTSGSTGIPKGVILSHRNVISSLKYLADSLIFSVGNSIEEDAYIAYLPMAHIMELIGETFCLLKGIKIGFSSPLTLIDSSLGIHPGTKGDMFVLRPTVFPVAPLVLERICKGIKSKIDDMGLKNLFEYLYDYKKNWIRKGYQTKMLDKLFFQKMGALTGGRVRLITCGGAPLAPHTHEFVRNVLCTKVLLSYGMTETSGLALFTQSYDLNSGRVGGPIGGSTIIKLVNWEEGNYRVTDTPFPRGEAYIGGDNISTQGYFKRSDIGDFFEEDGIRWIKTGDIVELQNDGGFNIIDRKKDLIKLSTGEYVSLGKVESILKTHTLVENICVVADPFQPYTVAIIVPIEPKIKKHAEQLGITETNLDKLCKVPVIIEEFKKEIQNHGLSLKLEKYEIPRNIYLSPEPWLPQSGLVTAALKNQRTNLSKHFKTQIQEMYG